MQGDAPKKRKVLQLHRIWYKEVTQRLLKKKKTELKIMQRTVERMYGDGIDSLKLMSLRR